MKKFIQIDGNNVVRMINYIPFDPESGMKMPEIELLNIGKLIDSIPEIPYVEGKMGKYMYEHETNTVYYSYIESPQTPEQIQAEKISALQEENEMLKTEMAGVKNVTSEMGKSQEDLLNYLIEVGVIA